MFSTEFVIMVLFYCQNILAGLLIAKGLKKLMHSEGSQGIVTNRKSNISSYRFYECATNSRGGASLRYYLGFTTLICAFIIYDVDLIFFFSEMVLLVDYGITETFIFFIFVFFFIIGLWMDYRRVGFS